MTFFSHRPGSSDFSHIFHMFTMLNVVYDHFLTRKTQFFTLFMLSRTSDNTTSQNIGGTNAWAVPPPQIFGGTVPPVPPRSPPLAGFMTKSLCKQKRNWFNFNQFRFCLHSDFFINSVGYYYGSRSFTRPT